MKIYGNYDPGDGMRLILHECSRPKELSVDDWVNLQRWFPRGKVMLKVNKLETYKPFKSALYLSRELYE